MARRPVVSETTDRELDRAVLEHFGVSPSTVDFEGKVQMVLNALDTAAEDDELEIEGEGGGGNQTNPNTAGT